MSSLAGRTIFITGASRGIGKAIALRCAKDGANIVIAAKTTATHPKLPGTIFTAAEEVEAAGGSALACAVDIQSEEQIAEAIDAAIKKFGSIDVLVNNASAIHLTGTEATPMKRYDLMHHINTRGTFLCSKLMIPHLKKSPNPHILNLSPPLNMNPKWFKDHCAYTMAKYGMSMCALGMSEEFRGDGIAVNCLWPRTAIYTAAMEMLGGGSGVKNQCRSVDIMSDAAYLILTKNSREFTGNFCIDEDVLKQSGVTDLDKYNIEPGATLLPDFFLDYDETSAAFLRGSGGSSSSSPASSASSSASDNLDSTFKSIRHLLTSDLAQGQSATFVFDLGAAGKFHLDFKQKMAGRGEPASGVADVTFTLKPEDFVSMFNGKLQPTVAFMSGKMKIKGDLKEAMKLEQLMKKAKL